MGLLHSLGLARPRGDVEGLYGLIVRQARQPHFYGVCGVPDTVGGRFDMLALHAYIVLRRLKELGAGYEDFSQALHDRMFADLDYNLREMGVGDLRVGRQVKDLATLFYGRISAYDTALAGSAQALEDALARNAYADAAAEPGGIARLSGYLHGAIARSRDWNGDDIRRAAISFPDPAGDKQA
jgi:cytochrome b pre-mRNA-processing protein 3